MKFEELKKKINTIKLYFVYRKKKEITMKNKM